MLRSPNSATPLIVGNSKDLVLWVHDSSSTVADVIFNMEFWPGVAEDDMIRVTPVSGEERGIEKLEKDGFLFTVRRDESPRYSSNLQVFFLCREGRVVWY